MSWITLERYAEYLAKAIHPVSGQKPVAAEFFATQVGNPEADLRRTRVVAHNLSRHGSFSETRPEECTDRCRKRGIRLTVEGGRNGR